MKKLILPLILMLIFLIPGMKVNAESESLILSYEIGYFYGEEFGNYSYDEYEIWFNQNKNIISNLRIDIMKYYDEKYRTEYPYYNIELKADLRDDINTITMNMRIYKEIPQLKMGQYSGFCWSNPQTNCMSTSYLWISSTYSINDTTYINPSISTTGNYDPFYYAFQNNSVFNDHFLYETNFDIIYSDESYYDKIIINNFRNNGNLEFSKGDIINISIENISNENYTEVNLDNYEYVILNLKDYNQKDAFSTNLQVKGMIGITPVYEFGTAEKSEITDRCNITYSDYTDYRFSVLKSDLQNNAVYYVKACQAGSSFKFDKNLFDITYITSENVDDPILTIGAKNYNIIPFNKLSNTANKNEENNFIPGESGSSLTDIIDNFTDFSSDIWNAISSFMGLVTKFFNTLPEEFRYLSITAFTTLTIIAVIKFLKG